jgi:hypothetical protein
MAEAGKTDAPALGVYFKAPRPTLGDGLDEICRRTGGKPGTVEERRVAGV